MERGFDLLGAPVLGVTVLSKSKTSLSVKGTSCSQKSQYECCFSTRLSLYKDEIPRTKHGTGMEEAGRKEELGMVLGTEGENSRLYPYNLGSRMKSIHSIFFALPRRYGCNQLQ